MTNRELRYRCRKAGYGATSLGMIRRAVRTLWFFKARLRALSCEGYENYHLREGSLDSRAINGHSALTWVADYTENGREMVECLTRARSENTNAIFYARAPAERLADLKTKVDPIIETLQIP